MHSLAFLTLAHNSTHHGYTIDALRPGNQVPSAQSSIVAVDEPKDEARKVQNQKAVKTVIVGMVVRNTSVPRRFVFA
jgi:hypothetical protein